LVGMASKGLGKKITCYTGIFSGFGNLDESEYAKIVARHCNVICIVLSWAMRMCCKIYH